MSECNEHVSSQANEIVPSLKRMNNIYMYDMVNTILMICVRYFLLLYNVELFQFSSNSNHGVWQFVIVRTYVLY